ncbi:MAG: sulfotransferase, partial [Croceibacterium sp.]
MNGTTVLPPRRTPFIDALDGSLRLARKAGLMETPNLDRDALMASAKEFTGLSDFGDPWFLEPFDKLLGALHGEARLNTAGEWAAAKQ